MKEVQKKYLLNALITAAAVVLASLIYALFQPFFFLGFVDGLFIISGPVLAVSGFRYLNNLGAYRIYKLILYKFKRLFSVASLSKRSAYVEEKTSDHEETGGEGKSSRPHQPQSQQSKSKEKNYEDFAYQDIVKDPGIGAMFYSALTLFLLSILLGFLA